MARRRRYRRRRRATTKNDPVGVLLAVALVVIGLAVATSAMDDDAGSGGDTAAQDRREAAQAAEDAEARAEGESGGNGDGSGGDGTIGGADRPARELLATLVVRDEGSRSGYEREAFGEGWAVDGNGCDTRERVLAEESKAPITRRDDCSVVEGRWSSLYDGDTTRDPGDLEIDHMVPLAEAWESGASSWTAERRADYANDTRRHGALIAVTAGMNQAKSDRDPAEWLPPDQGSWCRYVNAWIVQKHDWHLTIDRAERDRLREVLTTC